MRTLRLVIFLTAVLALAVPGAAQAADGRVLIPIFVRDPLPGTFGSSWVTDSWIANTGSGAAEVFGVAWTCFIPECGFIPAAVEPGVTFRPRYLAEEQGARGLFLYPNAIGAPQLHFALRFRDLSRQSETWGTELPVVRESEFRSEQFSLIDIPRTPGFRQVLRIYDLDGVKREALVRVRVYRVDPEHDEGSDPADSLLGETVLPLDFVEPVGVVIYHPGYAMVADLSTLAPLGDAEHLRLEIEPVTPGLKLWAFVTVIHNETQHATVITPQ